VISNASRPSALFRSIRLEDIDWWARSSEYVTQVTGIGPLGIEYVNAKDNPRNES